MTGHQNYWRENIGTVIIEADKFGKLQSINGRRHPIRDDQVRREVLHGVNRLLPVANIAYEFHAQGDQHGFHQGPHIGIVLDQ
jgi:hypothetical protein